MTCESRAAGGSLRRERARTSVVKRLLQRIEALMAAIAFAEEGEPDTARRIVEGAEREEPDGGRGRAGRAR